MRVSANKLIAVLAGVFSVDSSAGAPQASAQTYPSHNITAIIPFAPGNANDITARIVLEQVGKQLGPADHHRQPRRRRRHDRRRRRRRVPTPDGYTILFHSASFSAAYVTHKTCPTTRSRILSRCAAVGIQPSVLVTAPSKGYKTAADLIAAAKAKPGADELRLRRHRRGVASGRRKVQRRRRHQGPARSVQGSGRGADRGDGRAHRLLFPAARAGAGADQGRQGHGAGGQVRQARAVAARCADHGRDRLSGGGLRVLEWRVRSGEDSAGHRHEALSTRPRRPLPILASRSGWPSSASSRWSMSQPEFRNTSRPTCRTPTSSPRRRASRSSKVARRIGAFMARLFAALLGACGLLAAACGGAAASRRELADQADPGDHADRAGHRRRRRVPAGVPRAVEPARPADRRREPRRRGRHHRLRRGGQGRSGRLHDPRAVHLAHHRAGALSEHELRRDARFHRRRAVRQDADRAHHLAGEGHQDGPAVGRGGQGQARQRSRSPRPVLDRRRI